MVSVQTVSRPAGENAASSFISKWVRLRHSGGPDAEDFCWETAESGSISATT